MLIRRDDVEHLIMLSAERDIVIERDIKSVAADKTIKRTDRTGIL